MANINTLTKFSGVMTALVDSTDMYMSYYRNQSGHDDLLQYITRLVQYNTLDAAISAVSRRGHRLYLRNHTAKFQSTRLPDFLK